MREKITSKNSNEKKDNKCASNKKITNKNKNERKEITNEHRNISGKNTEKNTFDEKKKIELHITEYIKNNTYNFEKKTDMYQEQFKEQPAAENLMRAKQTPHQWQ